MELSFSGIRRVLFHPAFLCALALALCAIASIPRLEMGFDDDFSYIWTARAMANTGRIVYNGWATAMLGWQIYWGALFIKLFGFSFAAMRASTLVVGMATAALLQRLLVRLGINEWNSTLATLTVVTSPIFLPFALSFMSDVPGLFSIVVCLYGCVRSVQAKSDQSALAWLIFAASANMIGGTARQIAWLGALIMVPSTAWAIRQRKGVLATGLILWVASLVFVAACMHWFKNQPYSLSEPLIGGLNLFTYKHLGFLLFALPILIAYLIRSPYQEKWMRVQGGAALIAALALTAVLFAFLHKTNRHVPLHLVAPFSAEGISSKGIDTDAIAGVRPDVFPFSVWLILTLLIFGAFLAFLICVINSSRLPGSDEPAMNARISSRILWTILCPFSMAYLALLITRGILYDRYFLPLLLVFVICLVRFYQSKIAFKLPLFSAVLVVLFATFSLLTMHDCFAAGRARLAAAAELRAAGIPRGEIRGGFEYDGLTQLEAFGYINDPRLRLPVGAYHKFPPGWWPAGVVWFDPIMPAVQPKYQLTYSLLPNSIESTFPAVEYETWLPYRRQKILILSTK